MLYTRFFLLVLLCVALGGCYSWGPDDDLLTTVPVTNNPNLLPGPAQTAPGTVEQIAQLAQ